jgi:hypothetical protein
MTINYLIEIETIIQVMNTKMYGATQLLKKTIVVRNQLLL